MLKFLLGAATAFALLASTPAVACGNHKDCKDCPHRKEASAQVQKTGAVAEADKKDEKGCACVKSGDKDCKCGKDCKCAECPVHGKKAPAEKKS